LALPNSIINLELLTKSQADIPITSELWLLKTDAQTPHFIIYNHTGRCRHSSAPTFSCFTKADNRTEAHLNGVYMNALHD